jgi:hypothetical protein
LQQNIQVLKEFKIIGWCYGRALHVQAY